MLMLGGQPGEGVGGLGWAQLELTDALRKMMRRQVCSRQVNAVNCQTITVFQV